jgi:hypothetical protein
MPFVRNCGAPPTTFVRNCGAPPTTFGAEQQRTAENILHLIASLTADDHRFDAVDKRFDGVDRRFGGMENRFDRLGDTVGIVQQSAGFTRWAEQLDRSNAQILAIQEAQQHYWTIWRREWLKLEQRPPQ